MAQYGMIYDTNTIKSQLAEANRDYMGRKTWENLYGSVDLAKQQSLSTARETYDTNVLNAYSEAFKSNQNVMSSNIGQGYKQQIMTDTDLALEQAYEAYRNNYNQQVAQINQQAQQSQAQVTSALEQQADYTKQLAEAPYQYLEAQWNRMEDLGEDTNPFYNDKLFSEYTTTDETGARRLKTWEEIANKGATDEAGEFTGLYDDKGNLTTKGIDFYDKMLNFAATQDSGLQSFGEWLSGSNQELYDWAKSYNPYDYTQAGTNLGSFQTMVGLTSTDQQYSFIERFGGMTEKEVNNLYQGFTDKIANIDFSKAGREGKDITKQFVDITNELKTLTDSLHITADIEKELGMSFDEFAEDMSQRYKAAKGNWDIWSSGLLTVGAATASGAAIGATVGTKVGASVGTGAGSAMLPGLGTAAGAGVGTVGGAGVGAIIGGAIGLIGGTIQAIADSNAMENANRAYSEESKKAFNTLLTQLITYSQYKRRQSEIDKF